MRLRDPRFVRLVVPHGRGLALIVALTFISVALDTLAPWPLKLLVDNVLADKPLPESLVWLRQLPASDSPAGLIAWLAGATVLLFLATWSLRSWAAYLQSGIASRMKYGLAAQLFDHLQRLSLRFHTARPTGDLIRRVMVDCDFLQQCTLGVLTPCLTAAASLAAMFAVMWSLDPGLSLVALLVLLPMGLAIRLLYRQMVERAYAQQELEGEMLSVAEQNLTALPVVQAFTREELEDQRYRRLTHRTLRAYFSSLASELKFDLSVGSASAVGTAALMVLGGYHVLEGTLTVGSLLVFLSYLATLYAPLETLAGLAPGLAKAVAGARRVGEVLEVEDAIAEPSDPMPLPVSSTARGARIVFDQVTFGYEGGRPVLHDVCLEIEPGEVVALVGHSGAGKSTLVSLIPRLFDPWQGRVMFDGADLRDLKVRELRTQVALVLQESPLLPMSVAENIAYGRPDATVSQIQEAAVAAHADDFIRRLPQGYETLLGEWGAKLSGGERQRLAIARALVKEARVVVLDEPTSALDAQTESLLTKSIHNLTRGRTTLIIAHRASTIRRADRIVVLQKGRIVGSGSHEQLSANCPAYRRLFASHFPARQAVSLPCT
jgi:ATP-binding cassette subfamily B protein/subfamily B ATP-binding cassette protein MsbA